MTLHRLEELLYRSINVIKYSGERIDPTKKILLTLSKNKHHTFPTAAVPPEPFSLWFTLHQRGFFAIVTVYERYGCGLST